MSKLNLVLTGGGTGGGVYPALAVVDALRHVPVAGTANVYWVGTSHGLEASLAARAGIPFAAVSSGALRGRRAGGTVRALASMVQGFGEARRILSGLRTAAVLATGGYVCVPVVWAAKSLGVPVLLYLPDTTPGWAVRSLALLASRIAVTNERAAHWFAPTKTVVTGYPVRGELLTIGRAPARRRLGLPSDEPILLVSGGSRGSRSINLAIARGLDRITRIAWVVHVTGEANFRETIQAAAGRGAEPERYQAFPYLHEEFPLMLAAASLVVCRSGASVLGELPAAGLPALLVPYPYAGAHQVPNARSLADAGGAEMLADREVGTSLVGRAVTLLESPERLERMQLAMQRLARPDAAGRIARLLIDLAQVRIDRAA